MATAGTEHLFTMSMISSSAMPEMAITTPATGDIQRPMPEDSCIGRAMVAVETPIWAVTSGTSGPKAYQDALPEPSSMPAKNVIIDINAMVMMGALLTAARVLDMIVIPPNSLMASAKTAAPIRILTTFANEFPMAFITTLKSAVTSFLSFLLTGNQDQGYDGEHCITCRAAGILRHLRFCHGASG